MFLADFANGCITSTMSLYATSLGGSILVISLISAATGSTRIFGQLYLGDFSDRIGRRPIAMLSMASLGTFAFLITFIKNPVLLVAAALLNGITISIFGMVYAYIGDTSPISDLNRRMSLNVLSQGTGFTIGPILGGFVAQAFGFHDVYYIAACLAVTALVVSARSIKDVQIVRVRPKGIVFQRGKEVLGNRSILSVALLAVLMSYGFGTTYTFFPLRASGIGISAGEIGTMLGVRTVLSTIVRWPAGRFAAWLGRSKTLAVALALPVMAGILVPFLSTVDALTVAVSLEGIGFGLFLTLSRIFVASAAETSRRGIAMSLLDIFGALGQFFLVLAAGLVADVFGLLVVFPLMSVTLALAGSGALYLLTKARAEEVERVEGPRV